jgi:ATP-dependent RNA helicase DHX37/DHR1
MLLGLTVINPLWLPKLAPSLCTFTKEKLPTSVKAKKGNDLVAPHYGPEAWTLPLMPASSVLS